LGLSRTEKLVFEDEVALPGVMRALWHGGPFTVVRYTYAPGSTFPSHQHESAQVTVVMTGRICFQAEGEDFALDAGEAIYIPPNAAHGAFVPPDSEPVLSFNVFHPPRKENP